jgi:hypothetical protein
VIHGTEQAAARDPGAARGRIDANTAQQREIDLQPAVAGRLAREAVPAALDRGQQAVRARERNGRADVRGVGGLHDQGGAPLIVTALRSPRTALISVGIAAPPLGTTAAGARGMAAATAYTALDFSRRRRSMVPPSDRGGEMRATMVRRPG